jgi:hypothetical protein
LKFENYAGNDVVVQTSDLEPEGGFHVKKNTAMQITKTVGSRNPVTLTAIDAQSRVTVAINNAPSLIVTPRIEKGTFTSVKIKKQSKKLDVDKIMFLKTSWKALGKQVKLAMLKERNILEYLGIQMFPRMFPRVCSRAQRDKIQRNISRSLFMSHLLSSLHLF